MNLKAKKVIKKLVDDFDSGTIDHAIYTELIKGAMSFYKFSAAISITAINGKSSLFK